ncbi:hypothetical protein ECANGB1_2703 [Enterospora canceri]|uniref:Secreted protein n=1 Tax=Enterospora canceri TaxID=1081671 RepID=A0A1Y1S6N5_9MICR|nr:hypothetical protein ECANGB1_2703 [Enterospora canceri]
MYLIVWVLRCRIFLISDHACVCSKLSLEFFLSEGVKSVMGNVKTSVCNNAIVLRSPIFNIFAVSQSRACYSLLDAAKTRIFVLVVSSHTLFQ